MTENKKISYTVSFMSLRIPRHIKNISPSVKIKKFEHPMEYMESYKRFGKKWVWFDRLHFTDERIQDIISNPKISFYSFVVNEKDCGFSEVINLEKGVCELQYFALDSDFIGKGNGRVFLDSIIGYLQKNSIKKLFLNTCTLDHERALEFYKSYGFKIYATEERFLDVDVLRNFDSPYFQSL